MLVLVTMKKLIVASLIAAAAGPASAGPDFKTQTPVGRELAASDGIRGILPEDDITFTHASARLTEGAYAQIASAARWLRTRSDTQIVVEGYADHLGRSDYNQDLARRRAQAVRGELIRQGVANDRIVVVVYGESVADPAGNPLDRRVVMVATPRPSRVVARR
jgi:outer membrane protein OmpA-like peptidoglycan-associated protein